MKCETRKNKQEKRGRAEDSRRKLIKLMLRASVRMAKMGHNENMEDRSQKKVIKRKSWAQCCNSNKR